MAIVTYDSGAELAMDSTTGQNQDRIIAATCALRAGSSTNGKAGIMLALGNQGDGPTGRCREFLDLVETAQAIMASQPRQPVPRSGR